MTHSIRILGSALLALGTMSCRDDSSSPDTTNLGSSFSVVNVAVAPINVIVDGEQVATGLKTSVVFTRDVSPGNHTVRLTAAGTPNADFTINPAMGSSAIAVVQSSVEGQLVAGVLGDTAATPAAGKTKLRVIHLAATAPAIDIWRTQPDFATPTRVMFPFPYLAESSYIQSDAGTWTVYATTTSDANTKLAQSGAIVANSGEVKTVVLVDSAGVLRFRVVADR